jgi:hypothetical protein
MNSIIESMIKNSELSKKNSQTFDSMIALEVALPIAFIVVFLIILLLTYFLKEIVIRKKKKKSFAATNRNQHQNSRILNSMDYTQVRKLNNYANVTTSKLNESAQYYEEPRAGFYHVQKLNHNYNYEKIYSDKFKRIQSNLIPMPPIQFCNNNNKLCKIEETNSYGLPSIHNFEPLNSNETSRYEINLTKNKSKSINLNASQLLNKQMKKDEKKSEKNRIRRSYSNSKLDIKKWQSLLAKQKPCLNKHKKWPSKIMTEHELKTFLAQNKKLTIKNNNVSILNSEKDLYRIKKFTTTTTTTTCTTTTTTNTFETINPKLTETNIKKVNNRLSLMKALNINLSETKLSLKENTLVKLGQKLKEKTKSEKNMLLLKNVKISKEEKLNDPNSFSIANKHLKNVKYSRLCKSFTFLSHKLNDSITKKKVINSIKVNSFASDPSKLGSFSSFKTNQNNYLKSMHTFKTKGLSMSSIFEKVSSVTNWNKNVNSRINDSNNISNPQTNSLMFSNSSSLNSQLTTLMQTNNNFGSIIASNFGSVNLKNQMGVNSKLKQKSMRQRTYSDGNCLSESGSVLDCKNLNNQNNNNKILPNISVHSVSVSKLTFIRNRV